jgi:hypothetical protein
MIFTEYRAIVNGEKKQLVECNTKDIYWHYVNKIAEKPTSEDTWEEKVGLNLTNEEWSNTYTYPYKLTKNTRILEFQFKITHRTLACKEKLFKWKIKDNEICDRCKDEIDSIEHHLVSCIMIIPFWDSLINWWKNNMQMLFPIDTYHIILGIMNPNNDNIINQLNFVILHAMYYVYRCNQKEEKQDIYLFLIELKNTLKYMQVSMASDNKEDQFQKQWGELENCI